MKGGEEHMDISRIDKNFRRQEQGRQEGYRYYRIGEEVRLYGLFRDGQGYCRIPRERAEKMSEGIAQLSRCTAGGRARFSTDSAELSLRVRWEGINRMTHMPLTGSAGFALSEETGEGRRLVTVMRPEYGEEGGFECRAFLGEGGMRQYILHFPLYNAVGSAEIGIREDACMGAGKEYRNIPPVLYYGSSITQGGCASRADNSYQALIAEWTGVDFFNFGFSGAAKGERAMAEFLASVGCSLLVMDYDHNADSAEFLAQTHSAFYAAFRRLAPQVPVLFVTKPDIEQDGAAAQRREIVYETYRSALGRGERVYFQDGAELFGRSDRSHCTVDGTHPNDLGFYRMARVLKGRIAQILGIGE